MSSFEGVIYKILVQILGGVETVVNGGLVDVLAKSVVTFILIGMKVYLSHEHIQQEPANRLTSVILNTVYRTCILPLEEEDENEDDKPSDYSMNLDEKFLDYEPGTTSRKEYWGRYLSINLRLVINESINSSSGICLMAGNYREEVELEDAFNETSSPLSLNQVVESHLLKEEERALVKKLFSCKPMRGRQPQTARIIKTTDPISW